MIGRRVLNAPRFELTQSARSIFCQRNNDLCLIQSFCFLDKFQIIISSFSIMVKIEMCDGVTLWCAYFRGSCSCHSFGIKFTGFVVPNILTKELDPLQ